MAQKRKSKRSSGGRGSAEAIEKRRVARQLNSLLSGGSRARPKLDGRTEKRRQRLVKELADGKNGKMLKPNDAVDHANELLGMGETVASLKKQGVRLRRTYLTEDVVEAVERSQQAYNFDPEAWKILGINMGSDGKIVREGAPSRGRRRSGRKSKSS